MSDGTLPGNNEKAPKLRVSVPSQNSSSGSSSSNVNNEEEKGRMAGLKKRIFRLPDSLKWIPANWTWSKIKAALRCAIVAWVSGVVFVIPAVEIFLGVASFLLLLSSVLSPPSDPFISVLERELLILLFVTVSWAWSCLGIKLADLARNFHDPTVTIQAAATGRYVEGGSSVVLAVFLFIGTATVLYIKARMGPGPYLFATIFACICLDICLTTSALYPFPFYRIGRTIVLPLSIHSALALLGSIFIFPSSMSTEYTTRLQGVLGPLQTFITLNHTLLSNDPTPSSLEFEDMVKQIAGQAGKSEGALVPLAASSRLLSNDLVYGRFGPDDFRVFHGLVRRITGRANGMRGYFDLVALSRDRLALGSPPNSPVTSRVQTPSVSRVHTPAVSRRPSIDAIVERGRTQAMTELHQVKSEPSTDAHFQSGQVSSSSLRSGSHSHQRHALPRHVHHHHHHHHALHHSLMHLTLSRQSLTEQAVGMFESQRYMDLENLKFGEPKAGVYTERAMQLLGKSSAGLLKACEGGVGAVKTWLGNVGGARGVGWWDRKRRGAGDAVNARKMREELGKALEEFRKDVRHEVLEPYLPMLSDDEQSDQVDVPPHHYLFHCYVYQYHLIQFSGDVIEMLDTLLNLEESRQEHRLWTPVRRLFSWSKYDVPENAENNDDEDPDVIQGLHSTDPDNDLGVPTQRDPDALPPRNAFERVMTLFYHAAASFTHGNTLFAVKAGLLSVVLALPFFIRNSSGFAYRNRAVWAIIIGQLTISRFRGDTAFGLTARIISTFMGGVVGMVMWYISCGSGKGNPYGLAAVLLVCFPFLFYARLYWPVHPMINIIFFVTVSLVVGYSYQDEHVVNPSAPGVGFTVAWKRFLLVTIGVFSAFIVSFLPPSTTIRKYQRNLLATSSLELGSIYCSTISFANTKEEHEVQDIVASLIAVRSKLKRSIGLKANVIYEVSLRGRWPAERYQQVLDLQLQLSYSLSNLMSIMEHLEPTWTRAFLRRTRFMDPDFQGDVLAVFMMISSSLRTGEPLPQVTPSPLVHRFLARMHGLEVIHKESEEDYGLPRTLTLDTLKNEQYLIFCVGVSVAFGIVNRLDRLMVATKEIVGEQYHIHGLGVRTGVDLGARNSTVNFRPPRDV